MFSGLTNQMSTWIGKKDGNGGPIMPEEKTGAAAAPEGNIEFGKDTSPPTGSKLDMFAGVKSQMTGWLGGIPGLNRGAGQAGEGGEMPEAPVNPTTQLAPGGGEEHEKEDDRSSATGGADSNPASAGGTPTEDAMGQQAFGGVSTKALAGAKSLSGFLYSAVNKASKSVVEAGVKIKKTVEENKLMTELNKEQEAFIAGKHGDGSKGEAVAPWVGAPNEDSLREECLSLSSDQRNFLRAPPEGVEFEWNFEAIQPIAKATLALDPNLEKMRFELVPKVISEENFWRNYFYRVSLLRQSHELNAMASNNLNQNSGSLDKTQVQVTTDQEACRDAAASNCSNTLADSPGHEFVSDSMRVSDMDLEEVREGMKKLEMQLPKEDWERELEAELKDYEVVTSGEEKQGGGILAMPGGVLAMDKDEWEKQIDELLAGEDDEEDLK